MRPGCVICCDPFDAAIDIVTTKCGHAFHNHCIDKWLERSFTCPECRGKVCRKSTTKLFFNYSFDDTTDNVDRSLDILKAQLHTQAIEIVAKNDKIKELQTRFANSEKEVDKMHQKIMELENQLSALQRASENMRRLEIRNQRLLQENNTLMSELEHLNNVKTIVEGCCNDAKKILSDVQVHVSNEEGKVATHRIATYCSVIKRELSCSMDEKAQLQNELTKVKRKLGILQADTSKKIARLEQQVRKYEDLNSTLTASSVSSPIPSVPNSHPSPNSNLVKYKCSVCSQVCQVTPRLEPITVAFPKNERQKMNIVVLDREVAKASTHAPKTPVLRLANSVLPAKRDPGNDSVSHIGYNGLGGHENFVTGSCFKKQKLLKRHFK